MDAANVSRTRETRRKKPQAPLFALIARIVARCGFSPRLELSKTWRVDLVTTASYTSPPERVPAKAFVARCIDAQQDRWRIVGSLTPTTHETKLDAEFRRALRRYSASRF